MLGPLCPPLIWRLCGFEQRLNPGEVIPLGTLNRLLNQVIAKNKLRIYPHHFLLPFVICS